MKIVGRALAQTVWGLTSFFGFLDRNYITRRSVLILATWQTYDSYIWAKRYVEVHGDKSGAELGLILGAVLASVTLLQGFVLKLYNEGKN